MTATTDYQDLVRDNSILLEQKIALRKENDRLAEQLFTAMNEAAESRKEIERLNTQRFNSAIRFEKLKKLFRRAYSLYKDKNVQVGILAGHLGKMLDQHEAEFGKIEIDATGNSFFVDDFKSTEFVSDYIEAAKAAALLGRRYHAVTAAEMWLEDQPVTPKRDNLFDNFKGLFKS